MNALFKRALHFPVTKIIIAIIVCFSLFIIVQNFVAKPLLYSITKDRAIADPIIHIVSVFALPISYFFLFRLYDKRKITELSIKYLPKEMFGGFIFGFLTISLSIFILYLLGFYKPISFSTTHYSIKFFTILIVAALVEDLFHRGLIVREMENWLGTNIAIVIAMLVELQHIYNPNSNLFSLFYYFIWGFTMAMLFIYTKRIWLPFFFHLGWNFAQPFYGSNLTGTNNLGSIIQSEFTGPELLTGGAVGIEDSIFTASFLLVIGMVLYYLAQKEGKIVKGKLFER
jgi:membrane protease YdiL (CAAX protease family)